MVTEVHQNCSALVASCCYGMFNHGRLDLLTQDWVALMEMVACHVTAVHGFMRDFINSHHLFLLVEVVNLENA